MEISSVASTLVTNVSTPNRADQVEGNKPDGDGDRDDAVKAVSTGQTATNTANGTVGSKLDVTA